ncbi:heterokaryon incompatibility protein-domain-containing protein, partial [Bipolaris maydis]
MSQTTPIQVDDLTLQIGESLRSALMDLRRPMESRVLWADAICIDQSNIHERAKQVGIMGDIYTQATRTVVWLGPSYDYVYLAFDCITTLESEALAHQQSIGEASASTKSPLDASRTKKEREDLRHGCYILGELAQMDWWTRAWVVQEVCLASEKIIMCGQYQVDWKRFMNAIEYGKLEDKFDSRIAGICDEPFEGLQSIKELEDKPLEGNTAGQLLRLLSALRPRLATNPRDKVFAIMGLLKGNRQDLHIVVDYTASVNEVYRATAVEILRGTSNLDIFSHCIHNDAPSEEEASLNSWVPDWNNSETMYMPLIRTGFDELRRYEASLDSIAHAQFYDEPDVMGVTGQLLDVIAEYSDLLIVPDDADWNAQPSKKMFWQTLCTGLLDPEGEEKIETLFRQWRAQLSPISGLRKMKVSKFPTLFKTLGLMGYFWATWKSYGAFSEMIPHTKGRRLGRTKSGWLCLLPAHVKAGDKLILLKGATVPFIVRQRKDGYWLLVGDAYVHGIMHGQA